MRTLAREAKVQTRAKRRGSFCSGVHTPSRSGFKKRQAIATLTVNTDGIYVFWSLNVSPLCDAVALPSILGNDYSASGSSISDGTLNVVLGKLMRT